MAQAAVVGFGEEGRRGDGFEESRDAVSWRRAHEELVRLAATRAGLDDEEGRWLLRALRTGAHLRLGYGSFREYAGRLFGYSPRLTREKIRVAEALEELPELSRALRQGSVSFSAARELTRVATAATELKWLEAARGRAIRDVEELVSGHRPGSLPDDAPDPRAKRHVLRLEVSGEVLATFREAMAKVRRDAGEALDDDAAVLLLCRQVLDGPRDEGRSSYQVAITVCERCRHGTQQGRGELVAVASEVVEMAECDGQHLGHVESIAYVGAHGEPPGVDADANTHVGTHRATQAIPPALRRAVLRRDQGRCRVPGCRHAVFTDVHHLRLRADGGVNSRENLVTLCSAHHRAIHRGELSTDGTASNGLTFLHADGTPYGGAPSPCGSEFRAKAYSALTGMGYRETEAKRALAKIPANSSVSLEQLIRLTLRELVSASTPPQQLGRRGGRQRSEITASPSSP
jgi:5-methylcytosine-specific restriction endonuclease McrA